MLLQPGLRISCHERRGTLGALVTSRHLPGLFLLSAWHVLDDTKGAGDVTLPDNDGLVVARFTPGHHTSYPEQDAAIALVVLENPFANFTNVVPNVRFAVGKAGGPSTTMKVWKYGAATQDTVCMISEVFYRPGATGEGVRFAQATDGPVNYCDPGDSGAMWCSTFGRSIAIHSQGDLNGNVGLGSSAMVVFKNLGLEIAQPIGPGAKFAGARRRPGGN